jgi:hypothetical protein
VRVTKHVLSTAPTIDLFYGQGHVDLDADVRRLEWDRIGYDRLLTGAKRDRQHGMGHLLSVWHDNDSDHSGKMTHTAYHHWEDMTPEYTGCKPSSISTYT